MEIVQEYSTEDLDAFAYNKFITEDLCEIGIHLGSLMDRKNMAFSKLVKKIDSFFLLELICASLEADDLWDGKLCLDGYNCGIKQTLEKINYFLELVNIEQDRAEKSKIPIIVLLNKADLMDHGCYIGLETIKHMLGFQADFHETSMKTGKGVDDSIRSLVSHLYEQSQG